MEQTVNAVMKGIQGYEDYVLAYQSKVTPVKWLEPTTPSEIENAIHEDRALVIVPIAFVSDHSETLVELDIEYQELARDLGCKHYYRSESLNVDRTFIESLSEIVSESDKIESGNIRQKIRPATFKQSDHELR